MSAGWGDTPPSSGGLPSRSWAAGGGMRGFGTGGPRGGRGDAACARCGAGRGRSARAGLEWGFRAAAAAAGEQCGPRGVCDCSQPPPSPIPPRVSVCHLQLKMERARRRGGGGGGGGGGRGRGGKNVGGSGLSKSRLYPQAQHSHYPPLLRVSHP